MYKLTFDWANVRWYLSEFGTILDKLKIYNINQINRIYAWAPLAGHVAGNGTIFELPVRTLNDAEALARACTEVGITCTAQEATPFEFWGLTLTYGEWDDK